MDVNTLLHQYSGCERSPQNDANPPTPMVITDTTDTTAMTAAPVTTTTMTAQATTTIMLAQASTTTSATMTAPATSPTTAARTKNSSADVEVVAHQPQQDGLVEPYTVYKALELRKEVYRRGLRPTKKGPQANCNKAGYIMLLQNYDRTHELYDENSLGSGSQKRKAAAEKTTKTKHCMFRLINVMFSDEFAPRIAENNGPVSRSDLDRGSVNGKSQFWTDVASSFAGNRLEYGWLVASHPKFGGIHPSTVTVHSGVNLRVMWGEITSEYQRCLSNFNTESGTHDPDFYSFCYGRIETLYLHFWLRKRPHLLAVVAGRLPAAAQVDTLKPKNPISTPEKQPSGSATGTTPKRKDEELALLREMVGLVRDGNGGSHDIDRDGLLRQLKTTVETIGLLQGQLRDATDADQVDELQADLILFAGIKKNIKEELRC